MDLLLIVLLVLWMAGSFGPYYRRTWAPVDEPVYAGATPAFGGGLIHLLLVLAAVIFLLRMLGSPYYHGFWF